MISDVLLAVNVALEVICILLFLYRGWKWSHPLVIFVAYQVVFDIGLFPLRALCGPTEFSWCYWIGHSITYVLQFWACRPARITRSSAYAIYWTSAAAIVLFAIGYVWLSEHHQQFMLCVACGVLLGFICLAGMLLRPGLLPAPAWAGLMIWAGGEALWSVMAGSLTFYPAICAVCLCLFAWAATLRSAPAAVMVRLLADRPREEFGLNHQVHAVKAG